MTATDQAVSRLQLLELIAGPAKRRHGFLQAAWSTGTGRRTIGVPAESPAELATGLGQVGADVNPVVALVPRTDAAGSTLLRGHVAWVRVGNDDGRARLAAFVPAPSLTIRAADDTWALWRLTEPAERVALAAAVRWLADWLGGDRRVARRDASVPVPGLFVVDGRQRRVPVVGEPGPGRAHRLSDVARERARRLGASS